MKENKYDDPAFFEKYAQMPRSTDGLEAAGEWHAFRAVLPDMQGKRVLDLGCGFGWYCRYAAEMGAESVLGVDLSANMLAEAKKKTAANNIRYEQSAIEDFPLGENEYDIILSSLALHYVADYAELCKRIATALTKNGHFIFSAEHPVFTAEGSQDWYYGADGVKLHWPVDRYSIEGERDAVFLGESVRKYHRTVTSYVGGLHKAGFRLTSLVEPMPEQWMIDSIDGMKDELRRPMMLILAAEKM